MTDNFERFVSESTKLHQETLAEQIRLSEDVNKYSTWFLGLSTAGIGLLISRFEAIVQNSWIGPDCIKLTLFIVGVLLFLSVALGILHHYLSIKERNCARVLIAMFGAQRLIRLFKRPDYPTDVVPEDMHNRISRGELLNTEKIPKFKNTQEQAKSLRNYQSKVLAVQQICSGLSYVLFFVCSITK
jgi:hypothetical protein